MRLAPFHILLEKLRHRFPQACTEDKHTEDIDYEETEGKHVFGEWSLRIEMEA